MDWCRQTLRCTSFPVLRKAGRSLKKEKFLFSIYGQMFIFMRTIHSTSGKNSMWSIIKTIRYVLPEKSLHPILYSVWKDLLILLSHPHAHGCWRMYSVIQPAGWQALQPSTTAPFAFHWTSHLFLFSACFPWYVVRWCRMKWLIISEQTSEAIPAAPDHLCSGCGNRMQWLFW